MDDEKSGILQVGEVPVVIRRDSPVEVDYSQAIRSGAEEAYKKMALYIETARLTVPPYTDMRPYNDMETFLQDRLAELYHGPAQS